MEWLPSSRYVAVVRDDAVLQHADAADLHGDDVARMDRGDALRRPSQDHIVAVERHEVGDVRDELGDRAQELIGVALLAHLAVDAGREHEPLGSLDLALDKPGSAGAKSIEPFGLDR